MKIVLTLSAWLFMGVACAQPGYVPTNGLEGWWSFDNGNAFDLSGNAHHGTANGATLAQDRFGLENRAYKFNGTSDYISTNYFAMSGSSPRAVSFWASTLNGWQNMSAIAWGGNQSGGKFGCHFNVFTPGISADIAFSSVTYEANNYNDGHWHHFVFQSSNSDLEQLQIYMDGHLLTEIAYIYNPSQPIATASTNPLNFGRIVDSPNYFFNGRLDDIGIWNRMLTDGEIAGLYESTSLSVSDPNTNAITIGPNPVNEQLTIRTTGDQSSGQASVAVYTLSGKLVLSGELTDFALSGESDLDVRSLSNGAYMLRFSGENVSQWVKFVKE